MYEDDEDRFPRITFWQLLKSALQVFAAFADKVSSGIWFADLMSSRKVEPLHHDPGEPDVIPGEPKAREGDPPHA